MAAKIIVLGSLNGKLEAAFQKLATLQQKQNFSFAIITGNLFEDSQDSAVVKELLDGKIQIPLSTYFTVGTIALPEPVVARIEKDEEICENLHFLGKRSITKTSEGCRIVALGGCIDKTIVGGLSKEQVLPLHTADDAKALRGANTADILLTTSWPSAVSSKSRIPIAPEDQASIVSSQEIAELCSVLKPRYHFSASPAEFFYEREPFYHEATPSPGSSNAITRFISLAPFGNTAKAKALYAFNLAGADSTALAPVGSTASPFLSLANPGKRAARASDDYAPNYRFANDHDHHGNGRRKHRRGRSPPLPPPDECFFCLGNSVVNTHMICCIGTKAYVTTARGPLPSSDHFDSLGLSFPGHQLIVPIDHEPTIRSMGIEAADTYKEMTRYREALQAMVASKSAYKLGTVTWEISRAGNVHYHWQFLPVPFDLIRKGLVEAAFKVEAENGHYLPFEEVDVGSGLDQEHDFFRVWIWSDDSDVGLQGKELVMRLDSKVRFDLQFGRRVIAKLLGLEKRLYWRDVAQTQAEEVQDVKQFQEAFKPWDFS
ncbi:CwfJ C-terminus 2-domain-containing protein-like protein [Xylariaceae sp. FL0804]|nr:CwfJ C-terminus 2-domain-containing protein-like protein [Xylariaceae sp. FL0804]